MVKVLKQQGQYEQVVREANGGALPVRMLNSVFGDAGPSVLDEKQVEIDELTRSLKEVNSKLFSLQIDKQRNFRPDATLEARNELQIIEEENDAKDASRDVSDGQVPRKTLRQDRVGIFSPTNSSMRDNSVSFGHLD